MTDVEAAYFAGLIDGEGSISIFRRKQKFKAPSYEGVLSMALTDEMLVRWVHQIAGVGSVRSYDNGKFNPNWNRFWQWQANFQGAVPVLTRVLPHLRLKRGHAELFIEMAALRRQSSNSNQFDAERQAQIVSIMAEKNRRGRKPV